nr:PDR/VanB family oxidoreductase [Kibdelosporangium sp. MJ126-NF4]CEL16512.1 Flavodoxin reductases (ferredoxin-NADPH reductases) family 1; Vanillate O-demethylase oxidoreductase [Kibdelosporangium sp. MJ126-NF4]
MKAVLKTTLSTMTPRARPRSWQVGFAAFSAATALVLFPGEDAVLPSIRTMGVVGYALAVAISVGCAVALPRVGARRLLIGFHFAFVPLQFLFAFPSPVPNLGMVLSVLILVGLRPRVPRLSPRARKIWLTLHVGISVGWLGLSLGMVTLALTGLLAETHAVRHGAYEIFHIFDLAIVIPSVVLTIITGLVVALGTPWGLAEHWWVLVKFVISLSIPAAAAVESRWVTELVARTADPAGEPGTLGVSLAAVVGGFAVLLWTATTLSVVKPWGRTRWGRRELAARRLVSPPGTGVTIADRQSIAEGTIALALKPAGDDSLRAWEPGAHIDVVLPSGRVRQYSLSGDPAEPDTYRIAVLREPEGRGGSVELHQLAVGTRLTTHGPRNNFRLADAPAFLFVAGGIGITPFLPMINRLATTDTHWQLIYRGRSRDRMAFADMLTATYPDHVRLLPADTHPRPDLAAVLRTALPGTAVYCCGPEGLIDAVTVAMPTECPHGTLHVERFAARSRTGSEPNKPFDAELRRSKVTVRVSADRTLLAAIQEVNPALPSSCVDGLCGSCVTPVLAGTPDHRDDVLQPHERDRTDLIYPCVSRAHGQRLVLDA